jgi:acyl-CoA synthetase (AMP-forming)/AMP-acid ligase II
MADRLDRSELPSLPALLGRRAALSGSRPALRARSVDGRVRTVTYAGLDKRATLLAQGLVSIGIEEGDPVAFLFSNDAGVEAVTTYCAIHRAGAVAIPINVRFVPREIAEVVEHSRVRALLHEDAFDDLVAEVTANVARDVAIVRAGAEPRAGTHSWSALAEPIADPPALPQVSATHMADWLYTSGTTGRPKCAMLTHANCVAAADSLAACFSLEEGDVHLTASPFFTSSGCHTSLLSSMFAGATYVMSTSPRADDLLELIQSERATVVGAVPSIFAYMCNSPAIRWADLTGVKLVYHGGAAVNAGLVLQIQEAFPAAEVINVYGQTESGNPGTVLYGDDAVAKAGSIGRGGMPGVDVLVVTEEGVALEGEGLGEICLRSDAVMRGYLDDPDETANVLRDGWLYTGDLVRVDSDGFMYVYDRKKDMIIRGGYNVASIEVESVLNEHPSVVESAVVGKPHPTLGEDLKAYVVLTEPDATTADDLQSFAGSRLADFKVPRDFSFLAELPRNPTGKILKRDLRADATRKTAQLSGGGTTR